VTLAIGLIEKYQDQHSRGPCFRAGVDAQPGGPAAAQRQLKPMSQLHARLASSVIYANASLRASAEVS
jgi:hypothetical protein